MKHRSLLVMTATLVSAVLAAAVAYSAQDRYKVRVPGGLAFSEFRGYENWQLISISENGKLVAAILGNPRFHGERQRSIRR
jgi:hypothetical protein